MKVKFKVLATVAALGIISSGLAAWNFATDTQGETIISVGIEGYTEVGTIEVDPTGTYNLNDVLPAFSFVATYVAGEHGYPVENMYLSYEVQLNPALAGLISFGLHAQGIWKSGATTSITPTWNAGKNPTNLAEYNAIKENLANYEMRIILRAEPISETTPKPTSLQLVIGDGVTNGMELTVGDTIEVDAVVLDQYNNNMYYLKPSANLTSGASATYVNGVLSAVSPEPDGALVFSHSGVTNLAFEFSIVEPVVEHQITLIYGNGEDNYTFNVVNGETIAEPVDPVFAKHTFIGWYNGETPYNFANPVTGDLELHAHWVDGSIGFNLTYNNTYEVTGSAGVLNVVIPSYYKGVPVTSIGMQAFSHSSITSIVLPSSIILIGGDAFNGCEGLTSINIPEGVKTIEGSAFNGCINLASVVIPNSVTSIGAYAFADCRSLTSIIIPEGITMISAFTFRGCLALASVTLPSTLTSIGSSAFQSCAFVSLDIPSGVISIENLAFYGCSKLTSITIPNGVTTIEFSTFNSCEKLTSVIIPEGVKSIGSGAFNMCSALESITLPSTLTSIGSIAFRYCGLTSITIPSGVTSIGKEAFYDCSSLSTINNNSSVLIESGFHYNGSTVVNP